MKNEKEEQSGNKPNVVNLIRDTFKEYQDGISRGGMNDFDKVRICGALEAFLIVSGFMNAGDDIDYQIIEVKQHGLFTSRTVRREEKYPEFIIRKTMEFLALEGGNA